MPFFVPLKQETNTKHQARTLTETLILLDERDRVIGIRPAACPVKPPIKLEPGDRFFDQFPATQRDLEMLDRCRCGIGCHALLMHLKKRPVLMLSHFLPCARISLAVIPHGEVAELLDRPALYFDKLCDLLFAPSALLRRAPVTEEGCAVLSAWLSEVLRPFGDKDHQGATYETVYARLALHTMQLASLFGCHAAVNLKELTFLSLPNLNFSFAYGALLAIMAATHRLGKDKTLVLYGIRQEPMGALLCATFDCSATEPVLRELDPLHRTAHARGHYFEIAFKENRVEIFLPLCQSEISAQGIKALGVGEAPPIFPIPEPDAMLQDPVHHREGIPLFHNGKWAPGHTDNTN